MCHSSTGRAPRHMPFMLIISALLTLRFASAMACGVGLLAAQSFHNGEFPCGRGAPFAVSGFSSFLSFITIIYHKTPPLSSGFLKKVIHRQARAGEGGVGGTAYYHAAFKA